MIWLKALGIGVGLVALMVGAGFFMTSWDDFPEWLQAIIVILTSIALMTVLVWLVMTKVFGVA